MRQYFQHHQTCSPKNSLLHRTIIHLFPDIGRDGEISSRHDPGADGLHVPRPHGDVQQHPRVHGRRRRQLGRPTAAAATRRDAHIPVPERLGPGPRRGPEDAAGRQTSERRLAEGLEGPHPAAPGIAAPRAAPQRGRRQGFWIQREQQ